MKRKINPINIFIFISAVSVIISFFSFEFGNGTFTAVTAVGNFKKLFNDFVFHLYYSSDLETLYTKSIHVCFPPLIYLFYHALNLMLPTNTGNNIDFNPMFNLCAIYLIVEFLLFVFAVKRYLKKSNDTKLLIVIILFTLSSCFAFGVIQCANIAFLVVILLLFAIDFKESNSKVKRELAMILIAISAAIKIYPAVFGILYLAERRYKEAVRLILYGILFFFVPFIFTGGIEGFNTFLENQIEVQKVWGELSPNGIYNNLIIFRLNEKISEIMIYILGGSSFVMVFVCKDNWKKLFMLCFIMVMCPMWSGAYTPAFFTIPFLYLLSQAEYIENKFDFFYIALFSLLFTSSCFTFAISSRKIFIIAMILFILIIINEITNCNNCKKAEKIKS